MNSTIAISAFWILYGIAGLFGFQVIHSKYKGYTWTKEYVRSSGIAWIMLGIPTLVFALVIADPELGLWYNLKIYLALCMPALIYSLYIAWKYKKLLREEWGGKECP